MEAVGQQTSATPLRQTQYFPEKTSQHTKLNRPLTMSRRYKILRKSNQTEEDEP
jgi:hypothetical protein